jgi:hypothetical protein
VVSVEDGREILYMLVNSGGTRGKIVESWIFTEFVPPDQPVRNLRSYGHDDLGQITFAAGEMRDLKYPLNADFGWDIALHSAAAGQIDEAKAWSLYFTGAVLYSDDLGHLRRSVFRRKWDHDRGGFYRVDDLDQEYAD